MRVCTVSKDYGYDGSIICGVFSSEERAREYIDKVKDERVTWSERRSADWIVFERPDDEMTFVVDFWVLDMGNED